MAEKTWNGRFSNDDCVGCLLDRDASMVRFFLNGEEVISQTFTMDPDTPYFLVSVLDADKQEVILRNDVTPPESIDLIGAKSTNTSNSSQWGYKFRITPLYKGQKKLNAISNLNERQAAKWQAYATKQKTTFTAAHDEQIVTYIDEFCLSKTLNPLKLNAEEIQPKAEELVHYPLLEKLPIADIRDRFKFLVFFNQTLEKILPLLSLDFSSKA
jgi:hypothetical protein